MSDYKAKQDPNIPHLMLEIWESRIPIDRPLSLSKDRRVALSLLFEHLFSSNLSRWEKFVDLVTSSKFLSKKFSNQTKLFKWAIKPVNCLTVLNGGYTNEDLSPDDLTEWDVEYDEPSSENAALVEEPAEHLAKEDTRVPIFKQRG